MARPIVAAILVAVAVLLPRQAWPAGSAYVVDTAEVGEPGACKVEAWLSWAGNRDFTAPVAPACVVDVFRPIEISAQIDRSRSDDVWSTNVTPKVKTNIVPTAIGTVGLALSAHAAFDLTTRENTSIAMTVPVTLRLSEVMRININGGWQWDRILDRHYLTYGAAVDVRTPDNIFTLTAEVFGLVGAADVASVTQPRFQAGLRYRPVDMFSVDLIYGRNIMGENANWLTVATTVRFPPPAR